MKKIIYLFAIVFAMCSCSSDKLEDEFDPKNYTAYDIAERHMLTPVDNGIVVKKTDTEKIIRFYTYDSYKVTTDCDWITVIDGEKEINREVKYYIEEDGSKSYYLDDSNSLQSVTIKLTYTDVGEDNYIDGNEYFGFYNSSTEFKINKIGNIKVESYVYSFVMPIIQLAQ